jgi:hypothetical protein
MKRGFFSAGVLFLVIVGLLGALAVGYGLWSKTLTVNGTVTTGNFNADWDWATVSDLGLDPCTPGLNPNPCTYPPKDVGSCSVDGVGTQELTVTIENAYPSYECTITAAISNTGTIPFNVLVAEYSADPELDIICDDPSGEQVDPGDPPDNELPVSCWVHVRQEAKERSEYHASAILCVAQWNESPTPQECVDHAGQSEP